jgi:hypothetical protein
MGNCLRKTSLITDKYLFEPLNSDEESCFVNSPSNEGTISFEIKEQLEQLTTRINEIDSKIIILEHNTMENFKSISDDIYYINEKQTQNNEEETFLEPLNASKFASFINEKEQ